MTPPVNRLTRRRVEGRLPACERLNPTSTIHFSKMNKILAALIASLFAVGSFAADAPKAEAKPAAAAASAAPAKKAEAKPAEAKPASAPASAAAKK